MLSKQARMGEPEMAIIRGHCQSVLAQYDSTGGHELAEITLKLLEYCVCCLERIDLLEVQIQDLEKWLHNDYLRATETTDV